jgi:3',5'-cyclic AMP phosphodiesterase CpdA
MARDKLVIAHWTDIHVTDDEFRRQTFQEALANITVGIGIVGAAEALLLERLDRRWRNAIRVGGAITGLALAALQPELRQRVQFLLWLMQSSREAHRHLLFESLHREGVDHLFVTGDVSACSRATELEQFRDELGQYGWDDQNATIIPGNHDVLDLDAGSPRFDDIFAAPEQICRELAPGIILAGLDSNTEGDRERGWKNLWQNIVTNLRGGLAADDLDQVSETITAAPDATFIVGLHHPPCAFRRGPSTVKPPHNASDLLEVLVGKPHMLLCGHKHPRKTRFVDANGLQAAMANASALTRGLGRRLAYWVYEVEAGKSVLRREVVVPTR